MKVNTEIFVWKEKIISSWQNLENMLEKMKFAPEMDGDRRGKCCWVKTKQNQPTNQLTNQPNKNRQHRKDKVMGKFMSIDLVKESIFGFVNVLYFF